MSPGAASQGSKPPASTGARQATQPQTNGKAPTNAKEDEAATTRLLKQAEMIEQRRQVLRLAGMDPHREPVRPAVHWDFVLKEMRWMAVDFTEERHWKRAVARALAHEIARLNQRSVLKQTSLLDQELESCQDKEADYAEMLKSRIESGKSASTSSRHESGVEEDCIFAGIDTDGDLAPSTPQYPETCIFTYAANATVSEYLEVFLHQTAEANIIAHELDIRDYELDYEAAKKAAASAAIEAEKEEERRIKLLEKNPLGDFVPEDEELNNIASKPRRVKKPHHLDEFESGFDDEQEPGLGLGSRRSTIDRKRRPDPLLAPREIKAPRRDFPDTGQLPKKSITKFDNNGKRVNKPARTNNAPANRFDPQQPRLHAANAMPWTNMEDNLLCAVIHEFGPNYAFAAEILKSCCALSGICRRAVQCKERFKQLTAPSDGTVSPESALAHQITKGQAREIMHRFMPVPEAVMHNHCAILLNIGTKHNQMLAQERMREQGKVQQNQGSHASQLTVYQAAISKTANRNLNAMEMIEWAANKHKREQARQHQLEQQQQQALEAQRAQAAQQATLAAPTAAMGTPAMPAQAASMPQANGAMPSAPIQPAGFPVQSMGPPGHQSPAMMQGDPAMMAGPQAASWPSMGVPPPGTGSPAMNPAMQTFNGPVPAGVAPTTNVSQQAQLCAQKMQQLLPQIQKLQHVLNQGKNNQGQPLTDEQRQTYGQQLTGATTHYRKLQMQYQQLRATMNPQEAQQRQQQMQMQQQQRQQQQGMQPMAQAQPAAMRPAGYNFPGGMSAQRPNMGMQQATMQQGTMQQGNMQQGTMGMPQGPMSPVISGVGSMPPPQMNGMSMGVGLPSNGMMNQPGMHPHMMGQQPQAPGLVGMPPSHNGTQPMPGMQQMRPVQQMQKQP